MFTHKIENEEYKFIKITTASGASITLTGGHYIPVDGNLVTASEVTVGSDIQLGSGTLDKVVSVTFVRGIGLYNPQTLQGDIVVNGVVASTYTSGVEPTFAHAILSPFRHMFNMLGVEFTFLENGGGPLTLLAPSGPPIA
jgi:desert hedgehog